MRICIRAPKASDFLLVLLYFGYFFALNIVYFRGITPAFEYMGFQQLFDREKFFIACCILTGFAVFLRRNGLPSGLFLNLIGMLVIVPSIVLYSSAGLSHRFMLITTLACFTVLATAKLLRFRAIRGYTVSTSKIEIALVAIAILTVFSIFLLGGGRYINLDLTEVYELRSSAAENLPEVFGYINSIVSKVAIPFAIVFALQRHHRVRLILLCGLSILLFALTAHKSPIFYPIVVLSVYYLSKNDKGAFYLLGILLAMVAISALDLWLAQNYENGFFGWFSSLFTRRALLVPSLLNSYYIEFFLDIKKIYWAESRLSLGIVSFPYDVPVVNLIGEAYFGSKETAANTGWIGSGYANAGLFGVILYSFFVGVFFSVLDSYSRRIGSRVVTALFVIPVFSMLTSADLTTMILTHGLLISLILLAMIKAEANK